MGEGTAANGSRVAAGIGAWVGTAANGSRAVVEAGDGAKGSLLFEYIDILLLVAAGAGAGAGVGVGAGLEAAGANKSVIDDAVAVMRGEAVMSKANRE